MKEKKNWVALVNHGLRLFLSFEVFHGRAIPLKPFSRIVSWMIASRNSILATNAFGLWNIPKCRKNVSVCMSQYQIVFAYHLGTNWTCSVHKIPKNHLCCNGTMGQLHHTLIYIPFDSSLNLFHDIPLNSEHLPNHATFQ